MKKEPLATFEWVDLTPVPSSPVDLELHDCSNPSEPYKVMVDFPDQPASIVEDNAEDRVRPS
jgi:hypothetical protein